MSSNTPVTNFKEIKAEFEFQPEQPTLKGDALAMEITNFAQQNIVGSSKSFKEYKILADKLKLIEASLNWKMKLKLFFPFLRNETDRKFVKNSQVVKENYKAALRTRVSKVRDLVVTEVSSVKKAGSKFSAKTYKELSEAVTAVVKRVIASRSLWERFLSTLGYAKTPEKEAKDVQNEIADLKIQANTIEASSIKTTENPPQSNLELSSPDDAEKLAAYKIIGKEQLPDLPELWTKGKNPWEDMDDSASATSIKHDIQEFIKVHNGDHSKLLKAVRMLSNYKRFVDSTSELRGHKSTTAEVSSNIISSIPKKDGASLIVPGGYYNTKKAGGHTVIYELRKQGDKYIFTLINTGEGLQKVYGIKDALKKLVNPKMHDYQWTVSSEKVKDHKFWENLVSYNVGSEDASIDKVYDTLTDHMGQPTATEFQHTVQVNGTCTYDSIVCWLESYLGNPLFKELELFMTDQGLNHLYKKKEALKKELAASNQDQNKTVPIEFHLNHLELAIDLGNIARRKRNNALPPELQKTKPEFPVWTGAELKKLELEKTINDLESIKDRPSLRFYYYHILQVMESDEGREIKIILDKNFRNSDLESEAINSYIKKSVAPRIDKVRKELAKL